MTVGSRTIRRRGQISVHQVQINHPVRLPATMTTMTEYKDELIVKPMHMCILVRMILLFLFFPGFTRTQCCSLQHLIILRSLIVFVPMFMFILT